MTDEEKRYNRYLKIKDKIKNREDRQFLIDFLLNEGYKKGLAEGRKEVREHETTCVNRLHHIEKENAELKAQIEKQEKLIETQYVENQTLGNNNATLIHRLGELSEQVEKMKCCGNCFNSLYGNRGENGRCEDCGNKDNWEPAE